MNLLKKLIIAIALSIASLVAEEIKSNKIEIEIDPLAYALGGASGHVAYSWKNERIQVGFGMLDVPEDFQDNEEVTESFKAVSLKWDYFFGRSDPSKGFFAGLVSDYLFLSYKEQRGDKIDRQRMSAGLRTGYKFDLFPETKSLKGLYVTPWVATSYLFNNEKVELGGKTYSLKSIKIFPTIHIGWSF